MKQIIPFIICAVIVLQSCAPKSTDDIDSRFAQMSETKIHYKTCGEGEKTLVFVHGFGCNMKAWDYQVEDLCNDYKLVFIDLPGYGESDKPQTDYTLDFFAEAVKTVLDSLQIQKATFVGHSLGTPICRQIVFKYPEKVEALCDVDGVYCFYPKDTIYTDAYKASLNDFVSLFQGKEAKHNIIQFAKSLSCATTPAEVYEYAINTMPETPEYVAYGTMRNLIDKKYWTGEKINVPTLILCTQNSDLPPDNYQKMNQLYSNPEYIEFNDIGHFIMMENPKMFNETLVKFSGKH